MGLHVLRVGFGVVVVLVDDVGLETSGWDGGLLP